MNPTCTRMILKQKGSERFEKEDTLIEEMRLDIYLNGERLVGLIATPLELEALAVGYLLSEHIIGSMDDIDEMVFDEAKMQMHFASERFDARSIERLSTEAVMIAGCGKGHTANVDPETIDKAVNQSSYSVQATAVTEAMEKFLDHCKLYFETGAVHTAQLIFEDGSYLVAEDIAQHNTIDKVMGKAMLEGRDVSRAFMLLSGRLSSEMVAKSVMHGVPIVASRTAATCMGARIAEKFGLTIAGFVRGDKMNLYAHPQRIIV